MKLIGAALLAATLPIWVACAAREPVARGAEPAGARVGSWATELDSTSRVMSIAGFAGPESVRYDPEQDVYFVSNFNGAPAGDANGFISRVSATGEILAREFMVGTPAAPLHGPRGMFIVGDTLWSADADGLHGFDRRSGAHLAFVDFRRFAPGFLNDVARGPDGALYVTDTGKSRLYRVQGGAATLVMEDSLLGPPNGITWDAASGRFLLAPWGGNQTFRAWKPGESGLQVVATSPGGNFDGIEVVGSRVLVASQADSSLHVLENGIGRRLIRLAGRPADIGIDTRRRRVAIPFVALNRVELWALPQAQD